jgi:alanyl-tRNA synthetase
MFSMYSDDVRSHTAIHILKGAVFKVLGAKWSASAYSNGTHGGLAVKFERKPSEDEINQIERLANLKIHEDQPIEIHELGRKEAEERWGDSIYDLFPLPPGMEAVKVFHLPGWNVNTCGKDHTNTTGAILGFKIAKWRYRANKQLLEFSFDITSLSTSS